MNSAYGKALHRLVGVKTRAQSFAIKYVAIKEALNLLAESGRCLVRTDAPILPTNPRNTRELIYGGREQGIEIYTHSQGGLIVWVSPAKRFVYDSYKKAPSS